MVEFDTGAGVGGRGGFLTLSVSFTSQPFAKMSLASAILFLFAASHNAMAVSADILRKSQSEEAKYLKNSRKPGSSSHRILPRN